MALVGGVFFFLVVVLVVLVVVGCSSSCRKMEDQLALGSTGSFSLSLAKNSPKMAEWPLPLMGLSVGWKM